MKNKLYHRILAVALTVAMAMMSLPAAAVAEMTDDVSGSVSSSQMSDIPEKASEGTGNNAEEEVPNAEASSSSQNSDTSEAAQSGSFFGK